MGAIWEIKFSLLRPIYLMRRLGIPFGRGFRPALGFLFLSRLEGCYYKDWNV
jgi:hypothetical protein